MPSPVYSLAALPLACPRSAPAAGPLGRLIPEARAPACRGHDAAGAADADATAAAAGGGGAAVATPSVMVKVRLPPVVVVVGAVYPTYPSTPIFISV